MNYKTWKDGLDPDSVKAGEELLKRNLNGIFRDNSGHTLAYCRVEKTETGLSFQMLRMCKSAVLSDLKHSWLWLYRRDSDTQLEVIDISIGNIFQTLSDGNLQISRVI